MTHTFKVILLSALVSGLPFISQAAEKTDSARIDPGKVHEVCFAMEFGERLTYAFMSSRDMKFNIQLVVDEYIFTLNGFRDLWQYCVKNIIWKPEIHVGLFNLIDKTGNFIIYIILYLMIIQN